MMSFLNAPLTTWEILVGIGLYVVGLRVWSHIKRWRRTRRSQRYSGSYARFGRALRTRDGDLCQLCLKPIDFHISPTDRWGRSVDHILPRRLGGTDDLANLWLAHHSCNSKKGAWYAGRADGTSDVRTESSSTTDPEIDPTLIWAAVAAVRKHERSMTPGSLYAALPLDVRPITLRRMGDALAACGWRSDKNARVGGRRVRAYRLEDAPCPPQAASKDLARCCFDILEAHPAQAMTPTDLIAAIPENMRPPTGMALALTLRSVGWRSRGPKRIGGVHYRLYRSEDYLADPLSLVKSVTDDDEDTVGGQR